MKLSTIAKTSLALGILTTGVITTNAQSVNAATKVADQIKDKSDDIKTLSDYYNKTPLELRNVNGYFSGNGVTVLHNSQHSEVELKGTDKNKYTDEDLKDIDVFLVGEGTSKQAPTRSIGGITLPNKDKHIDHVKKVTLTVKTKKDDLLIQQDGPFDIYKEKVSLKELDFKLRKQLIKDHGLYTGDKKDGTIVVKMNSGREDDKYSFELDKKLQDHRMGDVIDSKNIKEIIVEM
ncbi:exotoxin beta-grasp domain-containing protein [Staphylococcus agnetis]|uniref:exotoxin beta-grasp domain-containing protein n=1 Tax=Staphylococcus agnetis TaxID=985762 RepID=UPI000CD152D2|nr:superantigen-like protein [Staphylococcus agnetis]MBY7664691.1 superantigen-like protein [Staphylococcus agnetis]NJH78002.1 superantigen-like protein [Staphylococcus agnetis]PNY85756.1 superantigen-like protein [Staphylococcus agnetis]PTH68040.1 superantigen-like protein [Staphylococcus agnetis]TRW81330.1 superantigen-like protein [Staphylococcus agnetis]